MVELVATLYHIIQPHYLLYCDLRSCCPCSCRPVFPVTHVLFQFWSINHQPSTLIGLSNISFKSFPLLLKLFWLHVHYQCFIFTQSPRIGYFFFRLGYITTTSIAYPTNLKNGAIKQQRKCHVRACSARWGYCCWWSRIGAFNIRHQRSKVTAKVTRRRCTI